MERNAEDKRDRFSGGTIFKAFRIVGWGIVGLAFAGLFALIFGFLVKWIWNMLMPGLFGLSDITFWQAFGIIILAKLIFGGFGPHRRDHWHRDRRLPHDWAPPWRRFPHEEGTFKNKYQSWKYYRQYWRDEGKTAFEAYVNRIEKEKKETEEK